MIGLGVLLRRLLGDAARRVDRRLRLDRYRPTTRVIRVLLAGERDGLSEMTERDIEAFGAFWGPPVRALRRLEAEGYIESRIRYPAERVCRLTEEGRTRALLRVIPRQRKPRL